MSQAKTVCQMDDEVDRLNELMYAIVGKKSFEDSEKIKQWIHVLGVSWYLERSADHCTNIAEDVEYLIDGDIFRHLKL